MVDAFIWLRGNSTFQPTHETSLDLVEERTTQFMLRKFTEHFWEHAVVTNKVLAVARNDTPLKSQFDL